MKINTLFFITMVISLVSCSNRTTVDMIVISDRIYTVDSSFSVVQAIAINQNKIVGIGSEDQIFEQFISDNVVDQKGKFIYPGFIDPHCHFLGYGQMLQNPWLGQIKSWEEVVSKIVEQQKKAPTSWVLGRGWNQSEWTRPVFPTKELLDIYFPEKPVYLTRVDGHSAIVNSKLLEMAGITSKTKIEGGHIELRNGEPTGLLIDNAKEKVRAMLPEFSTSEKAKQLMHAQKNCFQVGLTSVTDAGVTLADLRLYDSLHRANQLIMNVNAMLDASIENIEEVIEKELNFNSKLNVRCIKLYADGALGSRGALLNEPYSDDPKNSGMRVYSNDFLIQICKIAYEHNLQVATHCIGDKAVHLMLDIYGNFLKSKNDCRWRIEHSQVVHPNDFNRFGALNVIPSIQTTHATSDMPWAKDRLGERVKNAYAYQQLLQQNGWLPNGSDFPIEDINPLFGFYSAVVRKDHEGYPPQGFQIENALTREQAMRAMTIWAAKADFKENNWGSLEIGKEANFVVLDTDIMNAPENDLLKAKVEATIIGGKVVYCVENNGFNEIFELYEITRLIQ